MHTKGLFRYNISRTPEKQSLLMLLAGMDMDRDFPFACHEKGRLPSFIHIYRTQLKVDTYIVPISPSAFSTVLEFQAEKVNNLVNLNIN